MEEFTGKSNTSGSYEIYSYRKASFGIRMAPTGTTLSGGEVALNTYVGAVYPISVDNQTYTFGPTANLTGSGNIIFDTGGETEWNLVGAVFDWSYSKDIEMGSANDSEMYLFEADWQGIKSGYETMALAAEAVYSGALTTDKRDFKLACIEVTAKKNNVAVLAELKKKAKIKG